MSGKTRYNEEEKQLILETVEHAKSEGKPLAPVYRDLAELLNREHKAVENMYYRLTMVKEEPKIEAMDIESVIASIKALRDENLHLRAENERLTREAKRVQELENELEVFAKAFAKAREIIVGDDKVEHFPNRFRVNSDRTVDRL